MKTPGAAVVSLLATLFSLASFYIHFNRKGSEAMGRQIAAVIGERLQLGLAQEEGKKER